MTELNLSAQLLLLVIMKVYKAIQVSDLPSQVRAEAVEKWSQHEGVGMMDLYLSISL